MDVVTAAARIGEWPHKSIARVTLDGVEQTAAVQSVDLAAGTLVRGRRLADGEPPPPGFITTRGGYLFGSAKPGEEPDFLLETVAGQIEVEWKDYALAGRWLNHHGIAAEPTN